MKKIKISFFESKTYNRYSILIIIVSIILGIYKTINEQNIEDKILYWIFTLALIVILPDYLQHKDRINEIG